MSSHATGLVQLRCLVPMRNLLLLLHSVCSGELLVLEESDLSTEDAELATDLLLHEVEAHGQQRQTDEQIECTQHHPALRVRAKTCPRYVVAETDRAERDEAEIEAYEVVPLLDEREEHRAECDVEQHQQQTDVDRNVYGTVVARVQSPSQSRPPVHLPPSTSCQAHHDTQSRAKRHSFN